MVNLNNPYFGGELQVVDSQDGTLTTCEFAASGRYCGCTGSLSYSPMGTSVHSFRMWPGDANGRDLSFCYRDFGSRRFHRRALKSYEMHITRLLAYQVDLPLERGQLQMVRRQIGGGVDSTIVCVETDTGLRGYGEVCPLGPALFGGVCGGRAGRVEGTGAAFDRRESARTRKAHRRMDAALKGLRM